jgi:hypothetical protein
MKKGSHYMLALGLLMTVQLFAANAHDETSHQTIMALKSVGFWGIAGGSEGGINLCLRRDALVDVISGGAGDAMGSRADSIAIAIGEWQHVLNLWSKPNEISMAVYLPD